VALFLSTCSVHGGWTWQECMPAEGGLQARCARTGRVPAWSNSDVKEIEKVIRSSGSRAARPEIGLVLRTSTGSPT